MLTIFFPFLYIYQFYCILYTNCEEVNSDFDLITFADLFTFHNDNYAWHHPWVLAKILADLEIVYLSPTSQIFFLSFIWGDIIISVKM